MKVEVSSNKELVEEIRKKLKANGGYCPCALEMNESTKCMCQEFLTRKELGPCHCGLYIKTEV